MTVNCKAEILKTTRHSKDVNIGLDTVLMLIFNDTPESRGQSNNPYPGE